MMVNELLLATNNDHKHREFLRLFPGFHVIMPKDVGVRFEFEEKGETFLDNALGKARALFRAARRPVLADDSGLCVDALGGEPGVMSNRYGAMDGAQPLDAPQRNTLLLERMKGIHERAAHFVCCLVLMIEEDRFFVAQETVHGLIADAPRGRNGFGYDPLFSLPGRGSTLAEIPNRAKDDVSHRGRAARRMVALLRSDAGGKG